MSRGPTEPAEFDHPTRGKSYRHANVGLPDVRRAPVEALLARARPASGEHVLEFGSGSGLLTRRLLEAVAPDGRVVAMDNSDYLGERLRRDLPEVDFRPFQSPPLPAADAELDLVVTLASLHHVRDKLPIFRELHRTLRPGGRLVLGDVADATPVQFYFDEVVDKICSTGHKYPFLTRNETADLCTQAGLDLLSWEMVDVPWVFDDREQAGWFLRTIHDAQCSPEECFAYADEYLGFVEQPDTARTHRLLLRWSIFLAEARKPGA